MTIDVDGKLWVAIYNGWKVIMFITYNLSDHGVENRQTGEQFTQWDTLNKVTKFEFSLFLCGLHEVYSHIMLRPNLYIYLFVYESRGPVTWSSVSLLGCKRAFEYFCSGDRITS